MSGPTAGSGAGPATTSSAAATDPRRVVPATLAGLGVVAVLYALVDIRADPLHDVRIVVTTVFLLLGPGWAVAAFLHGRSAAERFLLAAATGTSLAILGGQTMAVTGAWYPVALLVAVAAVTVPVLVAHAVRGR